MSPSYDSEFAPEGPPAQSPPGVRCPICLDLFEWSEDEPFFTLTGDERWQEVDFSRITDPVKYEERVRKAYRRCPNPSGDTSTHYLPAAYLRYEPPLVIGVVGETDSGKTHLLAAMVGEIERGGLRSFGLSTRAVDVQLHARFLDNNVRPLLDQGKELEHTKRRGEKDDVELADALLFVRAGRTKPVALFDVSGEDLERDVRATQFLAVVDGLIFVVDPARAVPGQAAGATQHASVAGDPTFAVMLDRPRTTTRLTIPAVVVITKADRLRFEPPVDRWLRAASSDGQIDPEAIHRESRDAYAFLHAHGARAWLRPFADCQRCTLHFASATGGSPRGGSFPWGVRPRRVLEPLVALLAMTGVLDGPGADRVGC
jgi:Double-GTPase 2